MEIRGRQLHVGVQLQAQRSSWASYAGAIRRVEDLGVGSIWNFDHMLPFAGPDDGACFETLTTLAAMAVMTSRARIGTLVNGVLYRDPATLAKAAAQVDQMSGGRLELTLGAAWAQREFRAYGLGFPPLSERLARLEEALQIVRSLWTEERTTFEGRYYTVVDAPCVPKPVQSPLPPITVGGAGLGSLRIAARYATRCNIVGSPQRCAESFSKLERCCDEIGRPIEEIELSAHPGLAVAATREEALAQAERVAAVTGQALGPDLTRWVLGTPDEAVEQFRRYLDAGVSHFVFGIDHPYDLAGLRLVQEEVIPALV